MPPQTDWTVRPGAMIVGELRSLYDPANAITQFCHNAAPKLNERTCRDARVSPIS